MIIEDQIGRNIKLETTPQKIVSLVPSITYTLYTLGLNSEVKGITRFCKYPEEWKKEKKIIGGTKQLKMEKIKEIAPDLILANKEENTKTEIEKLAKEFKVFVSDVKDFQSNMEFINKLGQLFNLENQAKNLISQIQQERKKFRNKLSGNVVYFIWKDPWMSVGNDTFIHEMLREIGLKNYFSEQKRYPHVDMKKLINDPPDYIFLSSEPYPFKNKHKQELAKYFPNTKIILVKGEPFTWFGAYQKEAYSYFNLIKHTINNAY